MSNSFIKKTLFVLSLVFSIQAFAQSSIVLGVTSGPHAQIADILVEVAKKNGLEIKVVEFSDGILINEATDRGEVDANAFQHLPYLKQHVKDRGVSVVPVAQTVLLPSAIYSKKHTHLDQVPNGALVSIPNDPSNAGRTLKMLEQAGLIALRKGVGVDATELDIVKNPKNIKILPLDPAQLPRSLEDVDLSVINSYIALNANLLPSRDGLYIENELSDYFCIIAVAEKRKDEPWVKQLINSYQSPEVKVFLEKTFEGNVIAGW